jgi:hypothetical protein
MRIKVYPFEYELEVVKDLKNDEGRELYGQILYDDGRISINERFLGTQHELYTIWHEILHGILTGAGRSDQDELLLEVLSYGIVNVLRDNPLLSQAFQGTEPRGDRGGKKEGREVPDGGNS